MKRTKNANDSAAVHEAGHAVAGVLLDRPFEAVSLERRRAKGTVHGRSADVIYAVGIVDLPGVVERRQADRESGILDEATAVCDLAGVAAEAIAGGGVDAGFGAAADAGYISECVRNAGGSEERVPEVLAMALRRAIKLLQENWTAVNMVADILLMHMRLPYAEVRYYVEVARKLDAAMRGDSGAR